MKKITLLGQALIDYLLISDSRLLKRFGLNEGEQHNLPFKEIEELVSLGEIIISDIGGCTTNTAIGLNNLNTSVLYCCTIGDDLRGEAFLAALKNYPCIENSFQRIQGKTGTVVTLVHEKDDNKPRTCVYNHGVSNHVSLENQVSSSDILYFSFFSLMDKESPYLVASLIDLHDKGVTIIFDAGGISKVDSSTVARVLSICDGGLINEHEFAQFPIGGNLLDKIWIVQKNGSKDTVFYEKGKKIFSVPVNKSHHIKNHLGAGDAFAAGFLSILRKSDDYYRAIQEGNRYALHIVEQDRCH